jgi:nitrogen fixation-related uncharacterized protein
VLTLTVLVILVPAFLTAVAVITATVLWLVRREQNRKE